MPGSARARQAGEAKTVRIFPRILAFIIWGVLLLALAVMLSALGFSGAGPGEAWIFNVLAILFLVLLVLASYLRAKIFRT